MSQIKNLSGLASLPSPLPAAPRTETFTKDQFEILTSILEVFVPTISDKQPLLTKDGLEGALARLRPYLADNASEDIARAYMAEDPSIPGYKESLLRKFQLFVPASDVQGLGFLLNALNTRLGSYALTGYMTPISEQDLTTRTKIVSQWSVARLPLLRGIAKSMSGLARQTWLATTLNLHKVLDFPAVPKHIERNPTYDFKFHDFSSDSASTTLTADVVIVGSGCGAGVTASHLSRAGLKVLILEKSYHFPSTHFPMSSGDAGEHLLENGGLVLSDDNSTGILAGSTFGGGGTINWSASLQAPRAVREEWASEGLDHFMSAEYQNCLDTICERMGVANTTDPAALNKIEHNFANRTLLEGSRKLGLAVQVVPQNTGNKKHFCGYCSYGCAGATKQGPANCWFPDAASHGAEFIEGCWVEEVLFSETTGTKRATGVKAHWTSRDRQTTRALTIHAKRTIIASGTLQSPLVLLRSGLKNPHIGANLHLHPTNTIWAIWPHRTNPWEGAILTTVMTALENLDGQHHGVKVEVICSTPQFGLITLPHRPSYPTTPGENIFEPAIQYKLDAAKHAHATGFVIIARDRDTGKVYIDPSDASRRRLRVKYTPSPLDAKHILEGTIAALRIAYTMGAIELESCIPSLPRWKRPSHHHSEKDARGPDGPDEEIIADDDASFETFVKEVRRTGFRAPDPCTSGSAHQMGTCRMSSSAKMGVVDGKGKVFGTEGLYVADASVFPSASGVNPMISTMGIAEWISRGIVREVKAER